MKTFNTRNDLISALPKNLIIAELGVSVELCRTL